MVKASAQITITKVIDIYASYRYYKLQSSVSEKPSKPTTNPPDGWSDTEPSYISGSTNTLYFVDCNVYSDMTFTFSEVSISSSYEAAKVAWNKAQNAEKAANNVDEKLDKVLRYDDTNVILGKTGSNTTLKLRNEGVSIQKDDEISATFEADKLTLGGYLELGYGEIPKVSKPMGSYLTSAHVSNIVLYLMDNDLGTSDDGTNIISSVSLYNGGAYAGTTITGGDASIDVLMNDPENYMMTGSTIRMKAQRIYIDASDEFAYTIPVVLAGDCDALINSGKYAIGDSTKNRPVEENGWLEVMSYSDICCYQVYTTCTGNKYIRIKSENKWEDWSEEGVPTISDGFTCIKYANGYCKQFAQVVCPNANGFVAQTLKYLPCPILTTKPYAVNVTKRDCENAAAGIRVLTYGNLWTIVNGIASSVRAGLHDTGGEIGSKPESWRTVSVSVEGWWK